MKIIGFVEGARSQAGGVGLVGVPMIHQALAGRGHGDLLVVAGSMIPSGRRFSVTSPADALGQQPSGRAGTFAVPGFFKWYFAPRLLGVYPYVRQADFVTLHSLYSFPVLAGYVMARRLHKPYGLWPHGVLAGVQRGINAGRKRAYDAIVGRRLLEHASVLFYSSQGEREETRALALRAPSVVIPHGIDLQPFANLPARGGYRRSRLGGHQGSLVLYLGRLNEKKGLNLLIDAAPAIVAAVPDAVIAIAGGAHPPSFGNQVAEWIAQSPVRDHIVMTGLADEEEKLRAFADADVFVLPSAAENFGFAMFEAMASRVPVVVSDTLDYAAHVRQAGAGLTPARQAAAFSEAIASLLQDPARMAQMGNNGAALARQFSWEQCGALLETAVTCVVGGRRFPDELYPEYPA